MEDDNKDSAQGHADFKVIGVACLADEKTVKKGNVGSAELQIVERMSFCPCKVHHEVSSAERRSSGWL